MPQIQLLDGKKIEFKNSITGFDLTKKISKSLEKVALIMEVDGSLKDLSHKITKDAKVRIITPKDKEGLEGDRSDIAALLAKQEAGASFAITQLFFFAEDYLRFEELARARGVEIDLIPGIMPIVSPSRLARVLELTGEARPEGLAHSLESTDDVAGRREAGIEWAAKQVSELAEAGVDAVHLYAFNEYANVTEVLRRSGVV